jgi:hypothetical protein
MLADLMTLWPEHAMACLGRARKFDGSRIGPPAGIPPGHTGDLAVTPWPQWPSGEPDLVLEFTSDGHSRSLIIVEAKLGAPKSSIDESGVVGDETKDQLAKYFTDAVNGHDRPTRLRPNRVDVVYLTHHSGAPMSELADSLRGMRTVGGPAALYWLSWVDIQTSLRAQLQGATGALRRAISSVAAVLERVGYGAFSGAWQPDHRRALARRPPWVFARSWRMAPPLPHLAADVFWRSR